MQRSKILLLLFITLSPTLVFADAFEPQASYTVCFTPQENCTQKIVATINNAVSNIWVQAYSFTSRPIADALLDATQRGVQVKIIIDKVNLKPGSTPRFLARHQIPVWVDKKPAIAHNKVMIIDQTKVITGSFNFTRAAQYSNTENVLIIDDATLAKKYLQNWQLRQAKSEKLRTASVSTPETSESWWEVLFRLLLTWLKQWF